jgi:hypothetical protein
MKLLKNSYSFFSFKNIPVRGMFFVLLIILFLFPQRSISQIVANKTDSTKKHSPKLAVLLSTVVPGLGQAYNKKYWKIPIIYAGLGYCVYMTRRDNKLYNNFKKSYLELYNSGKPDSIIYLYGVEYTLNGLESGKNYYRRYRDLFVIFTSGIYLMNIIDANVDAQLFDFDISDDISLRIVPTAIDGGMAGPITGFKLSLKF